MGMFRQISCSGSRISQAENTRPSATGTRLPDTDEFHGMDQAYIPTFLAIRACPSFSAPPGCLIAPAIVTMLTTRRRAAATAEVIGRSRVWERHFVGSVICWQWVEEVVVYRLAGLKSKYIDMCDAVWRKLKWRAMLYWTLLLLEVRSRSSESRDDDDYRRCQRWAVYCRR